MKGAGSTLPAPLFLQWMSEYQKDHPELKLKYEVKNPTDAINQWMSRGCEFAVTDTPLTDVEERKIVGKPTLRLPVAIDAVVVTYNLPGVPSGIKLSPAVLSRIFMGTIKRWNNIEITEPNPGISFPNMEIQVAHRGDESSLHDLFPSCLAKWDSDWTLNREKEKNLHWSPGQNLKGNEKVMERLRKWPGTIAAVDYPYAISHHMPAAEVRNATGHYVAPTADSLQAAASDITYLPEDCDVLLSRSRSPGAYPLSTFAWALLYRDLYRATHDHAKGKALVDFLGWVLAGGQKGAGDISYVPLPENFRQQLMEKVRGVKF
ncbi:MAG TPA: phosphate ABC transporter substrate-binding protein PstS [bacterium]|nr:phosphate ABC transporter substrate-binding protein PstS [bacterium]